MAESLPSGNSLNSGLQGPTGGLQLVDEEAVPGGINSVSHVVRYVQTLRDYGWNQLIESAVSTGNYGAAIVFCAQARAECLQREHDAPHRPSAEKHFSNYMKFWMLEGRIERLCYSCKYPVRKS